MSGNKEDKSVEEIQPAEKTVNVIMPQDGLIGLASTLYPDDRGDQEMMKKHIADLYYLNADILRDDNMFTVGTHVRIPESLEGYIKNA